MHISLRLTVVSVVSLSCLASAFSTLFVTEGAGEGRKMEEAGTRTQKTEENNVAENQVIVETIPFFTDIFTKVEDVVNLTPLKVATIISGQHLINAVKSIPISGDLPQDTLNMLGNIFDEFNKTAQIIKLTAEYVNISSHYMLDSLNQFAKYNCDQDNVQSTMKNINTYFLGVISKHIKVAIKELTEKTKHREMTGTDVLVSSAYHIVAAFQEMTNKVMSLKTDDSKCGAQKSQTNKVQINLMDKNQSNVEFENSKHGAHKSIKKDQPLPMQPLFTSQGNIQDTLTLENVDKYPDLTIEIYPRDPFILKSKDNKNLVSEKVKIPESLKVAFLPEKNKVQSKTLNKKENKFQTNLGFDTIQNKVIQKIPLNFGEANKDVNPNEEFEFKILPSQQKENNKELDFSKTKLGNNQQNLERLNFYYYPSKTAGHSSTANTNYNLKVPDDLTINYYPQSTKTQTNDYIHFPKQISSPFKTFSLFGSSNFGSTSKSEGSQTSIKNLDDSFRVENLNKQDLTVEVFSPEAFIQNGKDESSAEISNVELKTGHFKNRNPLKTHEHTHVSHKNTKITKLNKELPASAVDNFRNVPPTSYGIGVKSSRKRKPIKTKVNAKKSSSTVLMPWTKGIPQFQSALFYKSQQKQSSCDEKSEPVCGIDRNKNNFNIFSNDCQRKHHNDLYKTRKAGLPLKVGIPERRYNSNNKSRISQQQQWQLL